MFGKRAIESWISGEFWSIGRSRRVKGIQQIDINVRPREQTRMSIIFHWLSIFSINLILNLIRFFIRKNNSKFIYHYELISNVVSFSEFAIKVFCCIFFPWWLRLFYALKFIQMFASFLELSKTMTKRSKYRSNIQFAHIYGPNLMFVFGLKTEKNRKILISN